LDSFKKEGIKDYSLHFDLTVPFARYTLDHFSELTFPFKRYQMQPVRRGERQQRGRFKEFWQCDVDCIWPSGTKVGYWYACETIATLQ
jgi:histidyl-tRNA synthetase